MFFTILKSSKKKKPTSKLLLETGLFVNAFTSIVMDILNQYEWGKTAHMLGHNIVILFLSFFAPDTKGAQGRSLQPMVRTFYALMFLKIVF